MKGTEK